MVKKSGRGPRPLGQAAPAGPTPPLSLAECAGALGAAVSAAQADLRAGDHEAAERCAKAVSACARAARDVAELHMAAQEQSPQEDVEAIREELRRRLARFIVADQKGGSLEELERIANEPFTD